MKHLTKLVFSLSTLVTPALASANGHHAAPSPPRQEVKHDKPPVVAHSKVVYIEPAPHKPDNKVNQIKRDIAQDKQRLNGDRQAIAASKQSLANQRVDIAHDRKAIAATRGDLRGDRREAGKIRNRIGNDRRAIGADQRQAGRPVARRQELPVHAVGLPRARRTVQLVGAGPSRRAERVLRRRAGRGSVHACRQKRIW